jgi:hypothetical protein
LFVLHLTPEADTQLTELHRDPGHLKRFKAVSKTLRFLAANPRHPGLQTHKYTSLSGPSGEEVFEAYAEQNTPAAYRIFWHYGPKKGNITVVAITAHP